MATLTKNVPSSLITGAENDLVFSLIGTRRTTRATTLVEVLESSLGTAWTEVGHGVACFVKDNVKKSYFIRVFNLETKTLMYELDTFKFNWTDFVVESSETCTLTCPVQDDKRVKYRFADVTEAKKFIESIHQKYDERATTRDKQQTRMQPPPPPSSRLQSTGEATFQPSSAIDPDRQLPPSSRLQSTGSLTSGTKLTRPKSKITKADLSRPSDFRHLSHVVYNPSTGAFDSDQMRFLLKQSIINSIADSEA